MNDTVTFDHEVVVNGGDVSFSEPVLFNNDIYLYGNSLKFKNMNKIELNAEKYKDNLLYVNELNKVFTDDDYALEQDDIDELDKLGIVKKEETTQECNYFDKNKDPTRCIDKIWRALRKKDVSTAPVCNCCCSPDTNPTNCIVQLIRSGERPVKTLQLRTKGEILYNIVDQRNKDFFEQITLQKSTDISTSKLLMFNIEKRMGDTDNTTGLVKIMFSDEFDGKMIPFPRNTGIRSIKLIIE